MLTRVIIRVNRAMISAFLYCESARQRHPHHLLYRLYCTVCCFFRTTRPTARGMLLEAIHLRDKVQRARMDNEHDPSGHGLLGPSLFRERYASPTATNAFHYMIIGAFEAPIHVTKRLMLLKLTRNVQLRFLFQRLDVEWRMHWSLEASYEGNLMSQSGPRSDPSNGDHPRRATRRTSSHGRSTCSNIFSTALWFDCSLSHVPVFLELAIRSRV